MQLMATVTDLWLIFQRHWVSSLDWRDQWRRTAPSWDNHLPFHQSTSTQQRVHNSSLYVQHRQCFKLFSTPLCLCTYYVSYDIDTLVRLTLVLLLKATWLDLTWLDLTWLYLKTDYILRCTCSYSLWCFLANCDYALVRAVLYSDVYYESTLFIARQHADVRYWYSNSVCPSVRPSVRPSVCLSITRGYCMKTA